MASKLLDPSSHDKKPVFLRTVYDDVIKLPELERRKHHVLKIRLFKEKTLVGHEFLILDVFDRTTLVRVRAERRPSRRDAEKPHLRGLAYWRDLLKVDFLVSDGDDIMEKVLEDFSPMQYHLITTLRADIDEAPTFAAVCKTLWEMQKDSPNYMLLRRQCYWFVGTAVESLKSKFREGEFTMQVQDGLGATRRGKPGWPLGCFGVYTQPNAIRHVTVQHEREKEMQAKNEDKTRQGMQAAVKNALTMAQEERRELKDSMRRVVQPLLTTPEAYQRAHWANAIANVEKESQKSKENMQRAVQSLLAIPATDPADAQYWQSVFRNATTKPTA